MASVASMSTISASPGAVQGPGGKGLMSKQNDKAQTVRDQNIQAAVSIANTVRTSLGPRGLDKMIQAGNGSVVISNDGATILKEVHVRQPAAAMLVELSKSQDIEAGDGTTSVVVFAGALLQGAKELIDRGIHPQAISRGYLLAARDALAFLDVIKIPVKLSDRDVLIKAASTSFQSKVVSQLSNHLAPMAVDAVLAIMDDNNSNGSNGTGNGTTPPAASGSAGSSADLSRIKVVSVVGGTLEDSQMIDGLVLSHQKISRLAGGPVSIQNAKIGLIQFCLSLPKSDIESQITIKDYQSMDRLMKQERLHYSKMIKKIVAVGCNVLLIQKSILRDAVSDIALGFLSQAKILVVRDIDRNDVDFISRTLGCEPCASLGDFSATQLGHAAQVCEEQIGTNRVVKFTGVKNQQKTCSVLLRASHQLTLDEAERSFHDALCVTRSLVKSRALVAGGGAAEAEMSLRLEERAVSLSGCDHLCYKAFSEALDVIPYTLAENAGAPPLEQVADLKRLHHQGFKNAGINVKQGEISKDMVVDQDCLQPILVTQSMVKLATETACMILKIDDLVFTR